MTDPPWRKGLKGNPKSNPHKRSYTDPTDVSPEKGERVDIRRAAHAPKDTKKQTRTLLQEAVMNRSWQMVLRSWEEVCQTTVDLAREGDTTCLKILWDRMVPARKAVQHFHEGQGPKGITINITGIDPKEVIDGEVTHEGRERSEVEGRRNGQSHPDGSQEGAESVSAQSDEPEQ